MTDQEILDALEVIMDDEVSPEIHNMSRGGHPGTAGSGQRAALQNPAAADPYSRQTVDRHTACRVLACLFCTWGHRV